MGRKDALLPEWDQEMAQGQENGDRPKDDSEAGGVALVLVLGRRSGFDGARHLLQLSHFCLPMIEEYA